MDFITGLTINDDVIGVGTLNYEILPSFISFWERIKRTKDDYKDVAEWWDKLVTPEIKNFFSWPAVWVRLQLSGYFWTSLSK